MNKLQLSFDIEAYNKILQQQEREIKCIGWSINGANCLFTALNIFGVVAFFCFPATTYREAAANQLALLICLVLSLLIVLGSIL